MKGKIQGLLLEQLCRPLSCPPQDVCVTFPGHLSQKDICVKFVFLFCSILRNEVVSECESSRGECKIGTLSLNVPSGPEGVSSLGSVCC